MKKVLFTTLFALSAISYGNAQQGNIDINAGVDFGLPIGDFGDVYGFGYGATVKGLYGISDAGQVGLTQSGENLSFIGLRIGYNFRIK